MSPVDIQKQFSHTNTATDHHVGLQGRFRIDETLLDTVAQYGGKIEKQKNSAAETLYSLNFTNGNGNQDFTGNLNELKDYLHILHQPIKNGIEKAVKQSSGYDDANSGRKVLMLSKLKEQVQQEREQTLSVLRFMTTGSIALTDYIDPNGDEDHSNTEHSIRTADMWRKTCEIDNSKTTDTKEKEPAVIENSTFNASNGFEFILSTQFLHKETTTDVPFPIVAQTLKEEIRETLDKTLGDMTTNNVFNTGILSLSPEEMETFCANMHEKLQTPEFQEILALTQHEQRTHNAITRIEQQVNDINSPLMKSFIKDGIHEGTENKINDLMMASSSLTSILASDAMQARWAHYFFTDRHESPLNDITEDIAVMQDVMKYYEHAEHTTPMHIEAMATDPEFFGLLSFEHELANTLEQSLPNVKGMDKAQRAELQKGYQHIQDILKNASIGGQTLSTNHLTDNQQAVLDTIERSVGIGNDGMARVGKEFVGNTIEFFEDIYKRPFSSKKEFMASAAILGWIAYMQMGGNPEDANTSLEAVKTALENMPAENTADIAADGSMNFDDIMSDLDNGGLDTSDNASGFGDLDLSAMTKDEQREALLQMQKSGELDDLTDAQLAQINPDLFHFNTTGIFGDMVGKYKHFTIDNAVTGTTLTVLDLMRVSMENGIEKLGGAINETGSFFKSANTGAVEAGDKIFLGNLFQTTAGHYPMIASLFAMSMLSGPRSGAKRIFGFFDGFVNSSIATVKDRPLMLPAALTTAILEPQTIVLATEADKGGFAFPLLAAMIAAPMWKRNGKSGDALHNEITQNARTLTDHLNDQKQEWSLKDSRPDILESLSQAALLQEKVKADLPDNIREISFPNQNFMGIKTRPRGLKENFKIASDNLEPTITALHKFDLTMDVASRYMDAQNGAYHNFVHGKIENVIQAFKDVQSGDMDVKTFGKKIDTDLRDVISAQTFIGGSNDIYNEIYGQAPSDKQKQRLHHHGKHQHGIQSRKERFDQYSQNVEALKQENTKLKTSPLLPYLMPHQQTPIAQATGTLIRQSEKLDNQMKIAWERTKQGLNPVWDKIVRGASYAKAGYNEIPHKKAVGLGLVASGLTLAGLDTAGIGGNTVSTMSSYAGYGAGALGASGMFMLINPIDDLLFAHLGLGGTAYGAGSSVYAVNKFGAVPLYNYAQEQITPFIERVKRAHDAFNTPDIEKEEITIAPSMAQELSDICIECGRCLEENNQGECQTQIYLTVLVDNHDNTTTTPSIHAQPIDIENE
ncbi:MAG: hypothetical protein ACRBCK_08430 [Alphaproteobacteria bacterium]